MLYAIIGQDKPDSLEQRMAVRQQHLDRLHQLQAQGRLILAGPFPAIDAEDPGQTGFSGSLIVAEFDSLQSAEAWAMEDPYQLHGVFTQVSVKPFRKVFPTT